ncbi:MAG TPA: tRNA (adenosine(37)-N6)-dimethylallyltransferase MiaA [Firmicutes bacterium]|nr:tRNA (adenosine(37)-N6)-dimethylallyltransferase MiaA [Bacillota bacterium]
MKGPLVALVGPTAVGKTELSIELALRMDAEVVSCDSMQIYRHMDIGTAKPSLAERRGVPHHLIDIVDPGEAFNVAKYQDLARRAIDDILARGKLPLLVGGTGLYLRAVTTDYLFPMPEANWEVRENLRRQAGEIGVRGLYEKLREVDSVAAGRIHPNDLRRITRALEVYILTGRPISKLQEGHEGRVFHYDPTVTICLTRNRANLYARINARVDRMMEMGLVDEVRWLLEHGNRRALTSGQATGYKELTYYMDGLCTLDEAVNLIKRNTRRYAKRQITWFKKEPGVTWVNLDMFRNFSEAVENIQHLLEGKLDDMKNR